MGKSRWRGAHEHDKVQGAMGRKISHRMLGAVSSAPIRFMLLKLAKRKGRFPTFAPESQHLPFQRFKHWRHPSSLLQPLSSLGNNRGLAGCYKLSTAAHQRCLETHKVFFTCLFQVAWVQRHNFIRNNY